MTSETVKEINDPQCFSVFDFDADRNTLPIKEKPHGPKSHCAVHVLVTKCRSF
jgi:dTDP-glucose pyrophosphorylase